MSQILDPYPTATPCIPTPWSSSRDISVARLSITLIAVRTSCYGKQSRSGMGSLC